MFLLLIEDRADMIGLDAGNLNSWFDENAKKYPGIACHN